MTSLPIGLVGFFGWGNFGDELFAEQWTRIFSQGARPVNDLLAKPYFSRSAATVAADFDALVIGGGDLIRTENISQLYWHRAWKTKSIVVSGIGVATESGHVRPDVMERLRSFLDEADVLKFSVRDADSQAWVQQNLAPRFRIDLVPDLGFAALGAQDMLAPVADVPTVGLVFNRKIQASDLRVRQQLVEMQQSGAIRLRQLVLARGVHRDMELAELLSSGVTEEVETFESVADMAAGVAGCEYLLSAKFHGLVAALANGRMCWSLRETAKAKSLMKMLGLSEMVPGNGVVQASINAGATLSPRQLGMVSNFIQEARAELENVRSVLVRAGGKQ
ncbi:polysaccharide pyruvyl transferase family protein [Pseudarthrobacter sp. J75]|uniref:polysaccharide pyruvyl transferase family protein n=1 Tax=Pseudarthrobacter sp. J75 TaxID=3116486 RepID=UPI002E81283E|nr:polysaccharide pyruvyl transferase family protein [Pseudarthrobacter sp. J75]MEE2528801.1 polysaccharide pyruvyl transferase family protein [Pseudarthrobacter sp. J75]